MLNIHFSNTELNFSLKSTILGDTDKSLIEGNDKGTTDCVQINTERGSS